MSEPKYQKWYGPDREKLLRPDLNPPGSTSFPELRTWAEELATALCYLDRWAVVPPELPIVQKSLSNANQRASQYLTTLQNAPSTKDLGNARESLRNILNVLKQDCERLQRDGYVLVIYEVENNVRSATAFLRAVQGMDERLTELDNRLQDAAVEHEKRAKDFAARVEIKLTETITSIEGTQKQHAEATKALIEQTKQEVTDCCRELREKAVVVLAEAERTNQQLRKTFEESKEFVKNEAMTAFGKAFDTEAKDAEVRAKKANWWAVGCTAVLVLLISGSVVLEAWHPVSTLTVYDAVRWIALRFAAIGILAWFVGYFFRERRNFLHVGVANRHRRNLCNAYIAIAEKMTPEERNKYLNEIVPHLSTLGKTGFIVKEDVPDVPGTQMVAEGVKAVGAVARGRSG